MKSPSSIQLYFLNSLHPSSLTLLGQLRVQPEAMLPTSDRCRNRQSPGRLSVHSSRRFGGPGLHARSTCACDLWDDRSFLAICVSCDPLLASDCALRVFVHRSFEVSNLDIFLIEHAEEHIDGETRMSNWESTRFWVGNLENYFRKAGAGKNKS